MSYFGLYLNQKMGKDSLLICLPLSIPLILLFSPIANSANSSQYLYHMCLNSSTYAPYSPFQANLNRLLLREICIEGGISSYLNTSVGDPPDEVYGLFLCRGDEGRSDCQICIDEASSAIIRECPGSRSAIIWYDRCLVRYSDWNFYTVMEDSPYFVMYNTPNAGADEEKLDQALPVTFRKLIDKVASDPSGKMYGTDNYTLPLSFITLFALVQCFPLLSKEDCSNCLGRAAYQTIAHNTRGARAFLPSCNLRFELYQFYDPSGGQVPAPGPPSSPSNNGSTGSRRRVWFIIVGSTGSTLFVLSLTGYFILAMKRRKFRKGRHDINQCLGREEISQEVQLLNLKRQVKEELANGDHFHERPVNSHEFALMQLDVILVATNNFSDENKLGQGGFGSVYKGILEDGKEIAVKRLSSSSSQGLLELRTELTLIARLQHRNLVRLLGCCMENDERLVIYEYMPNKSLDFFLFGTGESLNWTRRLSIINGIARGLLYLHEDSRLRIVHRDLKASNILLDHHMNPKISDFGMARIVGENQTGDTTNRVVGTYGYMAPEYAMEGLFSVKSDVFSFGVLLLELLSGKRNNGFHLHQHGQSLLTYAWNLWGEGRALELIDPLMIESIDAVQVLKCIHIGLLCVQEEPADRPTVSLVVLMLGGETISLPQPMQPAFSVGRDAPTLDGPGKDNNVVCSANELTLSNVSPR